jgi:hypothetical protein
MVHTNETDRARLRSGHRNFPAHVSSRFGSLGTG